MNARIDPTWAYAPELNVQKLLYVYAKLTGGLPMAPEPFDNDEYVIEHTISSSLLQETQGTLPVFRRNLVQARKYNSLISAMTMVAQLPQKDPPVFRAIRSTAWNKPPIAETEDTSMVEEDKEIEDLSGQEDQEDIKDTFYKISQNISAIKQKEKLHQQAMQLIKDLAEMPFIKEKVTLLAKIQEDYNALADEFSELPTNVTIHSPKTSKHKWAVCEHYTLRDGYFFLQREGQDTIEVYEFYTEESS